MITGKRAEQPFFSDVLPAKAQPLPQQSMQPSADAAAASAAGKQATRQTAEEVLRVLTGVSRNFR